VKIAIPRFGESVAPCFEHSATISLFTVEEAMVVEQVDFSLTTKNALDRVRLLTDQGVEMLICGGVQDRFEEIVLARGIRVISWVTGEVEELLSLFLRGRLVAGSGRLGGGDHGHNSPDEP